METHNSRGSYASNVLSSSDRFGWGNLHAALIKVPPYEGSFPAIKHLNVIICHTAANFSRSLDGRWERGVMRPNTLLVSPGGISYETRLATLAEATDLHLRHEALHDAALDLIQGDPSRLEIIPRLGAEDPVIVRLAALIRRTLTQPEPLTPLLADQLAAVIATQMIQNHSTASANCLPQVAHALVSARLNHVREYIHANLHRSFGLDVLARLAGLSVAQFIRQFKAAVGTTPHQYIMRARVEHAKHLLAHSESPVIIVATECGFSSQEHLTRVFGRLVGTTPAVYRKACRG